MATILIAGAGRLATAIEQRLRTAGAAVDRLRPGAEGADQRDQEQLNHAGVLVLAADSDAGNVDLALLARQRHPLLPLVVRLFDSSLAWYLPQVIWGVTVLSMSRVAAPVFADAARRVLAARPVDAPARPRLRHRVPWRPRVDTVLIRALFSLLALVFPSALVFSRALNLRYLDALYFVWTTVMTVGYGDITLKEAPDGIKIFGMVLMLAGTSFIAVLFALLSDWVLSRRIDLLRGRTRVRGHGHILIVGAGNLGLRIAELLATAGPRVVILERNPENRNVATLRAAGHHAIIADATDEKMLELAGLDGAAVVLAATDNDAVNLQVSLHAHQRRVPVIMRVISSELSAHVSKRGEWAAFSPIVEAAESFAQAALSASGPAIGTPFVKARV